MSVGDNIKARRMQLKMSQQDLADAMGYRTRSTIAKIESGENDVSQKKLHRFAAVLETSAEELISGKGAETVILSESADESRSKNVVIVLAGGRSGMHQQSVPNQFVSVQGKPIIVHCMDAYQMHPSIDDIYVVCLKGWENIVKAYANQYGITKLRRLIHAGNSGMESLKNALDRICGQYDDGDLIFVQEATRPLVTTETISKLLQACVDSDSATICHAMREYVQFQIIDGKPQYINRDAVMAMQSPEAHRLSLLKEVFGKVAGRPELLRESCCTMLLHHLGYPINFVEGSTNNIKIAREEDIATFGAMVKTER